MSEGNYIKLHRSIIKWEWYDDHNCFKVFLHCLLKANWQKKRWHGIEINRGQFVTSQDNLAKELRLTRMQIRTALKKLTNELTIKTTSKYTIVTICNYATYQDVKNTNNQPSNQQDNQPVTNEQPTDNQRITTTKEREELKKKEEEERYTPDLFENIEKPKEEPKQATGVYLGFDVNSYNLPDFVNVDLFQDFLHVRRNKEKPVSQQAFNAMFNLFNRHKDHTETILTKAIMNDNYGLFPPNEINLKNGTKKSTVSTDDEYDATFAKN